MLSRIFRSAVGCLCVILAILNSLIWVPLLYVATFFKILIPLKSWRDLWSPVLTGIGEAWISGNSAIIGLTQSVDWDVKGLEGLNQNASYFVTCNHQSWVDILVLQHVFNRKIPFIRFFLKQQLLYFPGMGLAWWALDFPFMKRYSSAQLLAKPELRGRDLEATRKSCERFKGIPVTILSFLEGTRFRPDKHQRQKSPYKHLLKPKAGGMAFALEAMGEQFSAILDVTIVFPEGATKFWDLLTGRINHIVVRVSQHEIPKELLQGRYFEDPAYRQNMKKWVSEVWEKKDELIDRLNQTPEPCPV